MFAGLLACFLRHPDPGAIEHEFIALVQALDRGEVAEVAERLRTLSTRTA
ncbi:hypothetical protein ACFVH6_35310 [Spirillospora sp. NPDC127200]